MKVMPATKRREKEVVETQFWNFKLKVKIYLREAIDKKLLGDVVFTVGIFKSQVEFVVSIEHIEAGIGLYPRASFSTTGPINVHFNVF